MTKNRTLPIVLALTVIVASGLACGPNQLGQEDIDAAVTATMAAIETERAKVEGGGGEPDSPVEPPPEPLPVTETPFVEPATATPTATTTPTTTPTPIPCDRAAFVTDVTVPDGSDYAPGEGFVKTWRLKNTGSCTWTSSYDLVFHSGDAMGAPAAVQLTSGSVAPGASVDVSVQLTAPNSEGTYKGFFRIRNGSGVIFGIGNNADISFWVEIEVLTSLADPDLVVTAIDFDPYPPTKNDSVTVRVKVKNQGGTTDEGFTVKWWPGEGYPNPATSWNLNGGLDAGVSVTLTYVYAGYPSTYASINTKAAIDTGDTVGESNEGNNTFLRNIKVDP